MSWFSSRYPCMRYRWPGLKSGLMSNFFRNTSFIRLVNVVFGQILFLRSQQRLQSGWISINLFPYLLISTHNPFGIITRRCLLHFLSMSFTSTLVWDINFNAMIVLDFFNNVYRCTSVKSLRVRRVFSHIRRSLSRSVAVDRLGQTRLDWSPWDWPYTYRP